MLPGTTERSGAPAAPLPPLNIGLPGPIEVLSGGYVHQANPKLFFIELLGYSGLRFAFSRIKQRPKRKGAI
jgi:hypothetical protein